MQPLADPTLRRAPIASAQYGLRLLKSELSREVVDALASQGPMTSRELAKSLVASSRTSVDEVVDELEEVGIVAKRVGGRRTLVVTAAGREFLDLVRLAAAWLQSHPSRPLEPSSPRGWRAVSTVASSWQAALVDWIVRCAPAPGDLPSDVADRSDRQLTQEIDNLLGAGVVELHAVRGRERYRLTRWGRKVFGVLAAVARWELVHVPDRAASLELDDAVVALRGVLPLARPPADLAGVCTLTIEVEPDEDVSPRAAAIWAKVRRGRVVDLGEGHAPGETHAWISGSFGAWLAAVVDGHAGALRTGAAANGDRRLADALVEQLHTQLFEYQTT